MNSKPVNSELPSWLSADKVDELEKLAAIGYTPEKVAMYFNIPKKQFLFEFERPDSILKYHYNRGILINEAIEAIATQNAANQGNTTQAQRLDKRRYQVQFENLKERIIYGKE